MEKEGEDFRELFRTDPQNDPAPEGDPDGPLQLLVTNIDYNDYVGRLAIGRMFSGTTKVGDWVVMVNSAGDAIKTKVTSLYGFQGLERIDLKQASVGDIVALAGIEGINIGTR